VKKKDGVDNQLDLAPGAFIFLDANSNGHVGTVGSIFTNLFTGSKKIYSFDGVIISFDPSNNKLSGCIIGGPGTDALKSGIQTMGNLPNITLTGTTDDRWLSLLVDPNNCEISKVTKLDWNSALFTKFSSSGNSLLGLGDGKIVSGGPIGNESMLVNGVSGSLGYVVTTNNNRIPSLHSRSVIRDLTLLNSNTFAALGDEFYDSTVDEDLTISIHDTVNGIPSAQFFLSIPALKFASLKGNSLFNDSVDGTTTDLGMVVNSVGLVQEIGCVFVNTEYNTNNPESLEVTQALLVQGGANFSCSSGTRRMDDIHIIGTINKNMVHVSFDAKDPSKNFLAKEWTMNKGEYALRGTDIVVLPSSGDVILIGEFFKGSKHERKIKRGVVFFKDTSSLSSIHSLSTVSNTFNLKNLTNSTSFVFNDQSNFQIRTDGVSFLGVNNFGSKPVNFKSLGGGGGTGLLSGIDSVLAIVLVSVGAVCVVCCVCIAVIALIANKPSSSTPSRVSQGSSENQGVSRGTGKRTLAEYNPNINNENIVLELMKLSGND